MCGIAGVLVLPPIRAAGLPLAGGGYTTASVAVARMVERLRHRGPDGCGVRTLGGDEALAGELGHTRLAILDLSPAGRQPMASPDGLLSITYNGEVYNFGQLRERLAAAGGGWRSRTDTEVILQAYAAWGRECLAHLRGMFAFAIWDGRRRELFLARDRLGIKPLYYYVGDGYFLFASEVRALLASGLVSPRLDAAGLWEYLGYQAAPAPRTLIQGVRALAPGSWLTVDAHRSMAQAQYWNLLEDAAPEAATVSAAESRRRVGELLRESVSLHLVSDVPVGVFLSGGIDSSAVTALVRESGQVPRTFSVAFAEQAYDETRFARRVADRFGADHTEILLRERDLLHQLPDAMGAMDQPTGDGLNTYVVARAVRQAGITVALSGLGGDELFAGYPSFARLARWAGLCRLWGRAPAPAWTLAAAAVRALGPAWLRGDKVAAALESGGDLARLLPLSREVLSPARRRVLLQQPWVEAAAPVQDLYVPVLQTAFARHPGAQLLARVSYAEARTYMHDVLLRDTDQMSMAHSLEVRVPLLDHRLAEYVIGLPDRHKGVRGTPKRLLVDSLGPLLPDEVVHRPKQGFTLPLDPWMRGPLRALCEDRLGPRRLGGRGIFRPEAVQQLWRAFLDRRPGVTWSRPWILVALEEWLERSGAAAAVP
jgi:asparagine synthase (glutamine-hydrolysing)